MTDIQGIGNSRGMLIRHGPPSDFGPYHATAVVWEVGQGNDDSTLGTRRFAEAPLSPVGPAELGLQVTLAAARYLDQTHAVPLLVATEALDIKRFLMHTCS